MLRSPKPFVLALSTLLATASFIDATPARACGGCFHAETDTSTSFVTDHRMAIAISTSETILWDQVKYTGSPSEFAWVLPVRAGTRIELAQDEWLDALDQATKPSVKGPDVSCTGARSSGTSSPAYGRSGGSGGSSSGGCSSSSAGASSEFENAGMASDASAAADGAGYRSTSSVEVVGQEVVGPYSSVIVRSTKGAAIYDWLRANGFAVPSNVAPILAGYTGEGFDFLALRLRPNVGVGAMQPVRIVMPGAITSLPLRMVAAGIGAKVGLTLFVVTEGRMKPANFPSAEIDPAELRWNPSAKSSNYRPLVEAAIAKGDGRTWLTEFAGRTFGRHASYSAGAIGGSNIGVPLEQLYESACIGRAPVTVACEVPLGDDIPLPPVFDAGPEDAATDASAEAGDAGTADAAAADAGASTPPCTVTKDACELFDDAKAALAHLHADDVWVTRLRAELDANACAAGDLHLEPAVFQDALPAQLFTNRFSDPNYDPCASTRSAGTFSDTSGFGGSDTSSGCACNAAGDPLPMSPVFGAVGVLLVLRSAQRRRR